MKKWSTIIFFAIISVMLFFGAVTYEDKFSLQFFNWSGIDSDEPFSVDLMRPNDMMNFDIQVEGRTQVLVRRPASDRVLPVTPTTGASATGIYQAFICQINGDTERVVIANGDGKVYTTVDASDDGDLDWVAIRQNATNDVTSAHSTFVLFKDTLLYAGGDSLYRFAVGGADNSLIFDTTTGGASGEFAGVGEWPYERILIHQDRLYAYGTADSTCTKIIWRPEFCISSDSLDTKFNSGYAYIGRGDGDFLTNVVPLGDHLMAYTSRSIYKILVSPTNNEPVEVIRMIDNIGAYGYDAVEWYNNVHYFVAENGIFVNNGTSVQKISGPIDYWFADSLVHSNGQAKVFKLAVVNDKLYVTLPKKYSVVPSTVKSYRTFVYDLDLKVWTKHQLATFDPSNIGHEEEHFMFRYEYNPLASAALFTGVGQYLKQRLLFVRDSGDGGVGTALADDCFWIHPSDTSTTEGDTSQAATFHGHTIGAYYTTSLSPITALFKRKQLERVLVYASSPDSTTYYMKWYNEDAEFIDSTTLNAGTLRLINKRLPDDVVGAALKFRIDAPNWGQLKINAIEIIGSEKGPADED